MGNDSCCMAREKHQLINNELLIYRTFKNVIVRVKYGDVTKEQADGVVCLYTNADKTPLTNTYRGTLREDLERLPVENLIQSQVESYKQVVFYRVKQSENENDLQYYYNAYKESISLLNDENCSHIIIADCPNRIQRAYSAEVLMRAVLDYLDESETQIKQITIMNSEKKCTRFLKYELIKYIEETQQSFRKERQSKFMKFITSTRSVTSQKLDCNFSIDDYDLGDESKLTNQII